MPAIHIRKARPEDAEAVLACLRSAFEPYRARYTPEAFDDTVVSLGTIQRRFCEMVVLVAVDEAAAIVGTVGYQSIDGPGKHGEHVGHIRGMAVHPDYLGTGTAASLLQAVETELGDRGCSAVTLDTTAPLERAIRFYERNGFRFSGTVRDFFGMPLFEYTKPLRDGRRVARPGGNATT